MVDPLPCPFCADPGVLVTTARGSRVQCFSCHTLGPFVAYAMTPIETTKMEAVRRWNERKTHECPNP